MRESVLHPSKGCVDHREYLFSILATLRTQCPRSQIKGSPSLEFITTLTLIFVKRHLFLSPRRFPAMCHSPQESRLCQCLFLTRLFGAYLAAVCNFITALDPSDFDWHIYLPCISLLILAFYIAIFLRIARISGCCIKSCRACIWSFLLSLFSNVIIWSDNALKLGGYCAQILFSV